MLMQGALGSTVSLLFVGVISFFAVTPALATAEGHQEKTTEKTSVRVSTEQAKNHRGEALIMVEFTLEGIVNRGYFETDAGRAWRRAHIHERDVEVVRKLGEDGVWALEEYYWKTKSPVHRRYTIRLLGRLAGARIVPPLKRIIKEEKDAYLRKSALGFLTQNAPWKLVEPILREAAKSDPDPTVRATAANYLKSYRPKP